MPSSVSVNVFAVAVEVLVNELAPYVPDFTGLPVTKPVSFGEVDVNVPLPPFGSV
ncbi:Uncharacterised protein [Burkholderia pseudomallei]|nr:Uncharacterised protein [Burkholderia pseudomallei]